jgi:hypothetical protein
MELEWVIPKGIWSFDSDGLWILSLKKHSRAILQSHPKALALSPSFSCILDRLSQFIF